MFHSFICCNDVIFEVFPMSKSSTYYPLGGLSLILLFLLICATSCKDKSAQNGWGTEVLTPLAGTEVTINDIVADSLLGYQGDSTLSLVYSESIYEFNPEEELLEIPDTSLVSNIKIDSLVPMPTQGTSPSNAKSGSQPIELFRKDKLLVYNFNGPELTFLRIRSGELEIFIQSTIPDSLFFEFNMSEARDKQGQILKETDIAPPAPDGGSSTVRRTVDISGYEVDLRGPGNNGFNTIQPIIIGEVESLNSIGNVTSDDSVNISYKLKNIVPQYVKGYLGKDTVEVGKETIDFNAFENVKSGLFDIDEVRAQFSVRNGLGVEGKILVNSLKSIKGNQEVSLNSSVTSQPIRIQRAYDNPRITNTTSVTLNQQNANIEEMIELMPSQFYYDIEAFINPRGNYFNYQDFGYYDSPFDVNFDVEIPMRVRLQDLVLQDTTDFNLGLSDKELQNIEKGKLNLITYNSFPYEIDLQMYLYDEAFKRIDSLFIDNTIEGGRLNDSCRVTEDRRTQLTSVIGQERLADIQGAKKAVIEATFSNPQTPSFCKQRKLSIYDDYKVDITLSARFKYLLRDTF